MKTNFWCLLTLWSLVIGHWSFPAAAVLPEPDNVIYGIVTRDGTPVTAADYDVVVELRRTTNGPAMARYPMGSNPRAGDFYSLRIPLETLSPKFDPNASFIGDQLFIVVTDYNGDRDLRSVTVTERGQFTRLDFGNPNADSNGNALPDAWELAYGITGTGNGDQDVDGISDRNEYLAGTDPNNSNDAFALSISLISNQPALSFLARKAEGVGYSNLTRYYSLECTTDLAGGIWLGVGNYTNIIGNNQIVTCSHPLTNNAAFYRARVWLRSP